jgi:hypothetical protein
MLKDAFHVFVRVVIYTAVVHLRSGGSGLPATRRICADWRGLCTALLEIGTHLALSQRTCRSVLPAWHFAFDCACWRVSGAACSLPLSVLNRLLLNASMLEPACVDQWWWAQPSQHVVFCFACA